jgi:hypothetical protein
MTLTKGMNYRSNWAGLVLYYMKGELDTGSKAGMTGYWAPGQARGDKSYPNLGRQEAVEAGVAKEVLD